jgi:hypothetical protein
MSVSAEVRRTLVKSPPELWAELSDPATLARHLGELGEIRIVRTEPDRAVDWEAATDDGTRISGRVEIEASGWGTRVTLSASRAVVAPEPEPESEPEPEPEPEPEMIEVTPAPEPQPEIAEAEPRPGFFARLFRRRRERRSSGAIEEEPAIAEAAPTPEEPVQAEESAPEPDISAELAELEEQTTAVLTGVLDRLGAAHHRPFSRS